MEHYAAAAGHLGVFVSSCDQWEIESGFAAHHSLLAPLRLGVIIPLLFVRGDDDIGWLDPGASPGQNRLRGGPMPNTLYYGDEAAAAGVHETEFGRFPRLQILTPADLFHGADARLPPLAPINCRHARVETRASHKDGAHGNLL